MTTMVRTLREAVADAASALTRSGCATPRLDAEVLAAAALGVERERIHIDGAELLTRDADAAITAFVERRAAREPVAYIIGRRAFRRLDLAVDRRVLVPRPETELIVEIAVELPNGSHVHDVGTGSGAVGLAIKDERPDLIVTASDASAGAVDVARANAARLALDVDIACASGLPPASSRADLVVANLPYVREEEWAGLDPEITRYEPREALVAGARGLEAIERLVATAPSGASLALEHAPSQAAAVRQLLRGARTARDLAGRERVTLGRAP